MKRFRQWALYTVCIFLAAFTLRSVLKFGSTDTPDVRPKISNQIQEKLAALRSETETSIKVIQQDGKEVLRQLSEESKFAEQEKVELQSRRLEMDQSMTKAIDGAISSYTRQQIHILMEFVIRLASGKNDAVCTAATTTLPLLSWRVHLLPHIGEQSLYKEFHLDESWDSPHNISLLNRMPLLYKEWSDEPSSTNCRFLAIDADHCFGINGRIQPLSAVLDPKSDTLALVLVSKELSVPWTKPADLQIDEASFASFIEKMPQGLFFITTVEGAALTFDPRGSFENFWALATIDGNEPNAVDNMVSEKYRLYLDSRTEH